MRFLSNKPISMICLFSLMLYVRVNSYNHVGVVSSPNHTFFLGKLDQAVNQYFVHLPSWISGREENGCRNYFTINLCQSMGQGWVELATPGSAFQWDFAQIMSLISQWTSTMKIIPPVYVPKNLCKTATKKQTKTNGSLRRSKVLQNTPLGAFCNTLDLHQLSGNWSWKPTCGLFKCGCFTKVLL